MDNGIDDTLVSGVREGKTCNQNQQSADIRKFQSRARSFALEQGIGEAISFYEGIGSTRKEERIRYLKDYWASRVQEMPKVKLHTSLNAKYSCAICGVSIDGMRWGDLEKGGMRRGTDFTCCAGFEKR